MRIPLRIIQTIIILSFFLPFVECCTLREKKGGETRVDSMTTDSVVVDPIRIGMTSDSAFHDSISYFLEDSSQLLLETDSIHNKPEIVYQHIPMTPLDKIWVALTFPEYSKGLTGFGYSVAVAMKIFEGDIEDAEWSSFFIPISFILSVIVLLIPFKKIKVLITLSMIELLCLLIFLLMYIKDLEELLFGFWIAVVFSLLNNVILFWNVKRF